jgi:hypothetical protein
MPGQESWPPSLADLRGHLYMYVLNNTLILGNEFTPFLKHFYILTTFPEICLGKNTYLWIFLMSLKNHPFLKISLTGMRVRLKDKDGK